MPNSLALADTYSRIPHDLSGSMSKNRFRQELFWGISKMFDLFDRENFCFVFTTSAMSKYILAIPLNSIKFYQIRTHKVQSPYKFTALKKIDGKQSIIAKLYLLKDASSPDIPIKCGHSPQPAVSLSQSIPQFPPVTASYRSLTPIVPC